MSIYSVYLEKPSDKDAIVTRIKNNFGDAETYFYSENIFFLSVSGISIDELAKILGFSHNDKVTGYILRMSAIQGFTDISLWDWMNDNDSKTKRTR